jgi:hypothetical protein
MPMKLLEMRRKKHRSLKSNPNLFVCPAWVVSALSLSSPTQGFGFIQSVSVARAQVYTVGMYWNRYRYRYSVSNWSAYGHCSGMEACIHTL